jgi:hypothetical protein
MFLGNSMGNTNGHTVRIYNMANSVLSHNLWDGPYGEGKNNLKFHAEGTPPVFPSENIVFSYNRVSHNRPSLVGFKPQSDSAGDGEINRQAIFEGNFGGEIEVSGEDITIRNNIFRNYGLPIVLFKQAVHSPSGNYWVYNNTCYNTATGQSACVTWRDKHGVPSNMNAWSNLLYTPNGNPVVVSDGIQGSGNLGLSGSSQNPFAASNPQSPSDFELTRDTSGAGAGASWIVGPYGYGGVPGASPTPTPTPTPSPTPTPPLAAPVLFD